MMHVEVMNIKGGEGSCNFCNRATLDKSGRDLIFPYDQVIIFSRGYHEGIAPRICKQCLNEFFALTRAWIDL